MKKRGMQLRPEYVFEMTCECGLIYYLEAFRTTNIFRHRWAMPLCWINGHGYHLDGRGLRQTLKDLGERNKGESRCLSFGDALLIE